MWRSYQTTTTQKGEWFQCDDAQAEAIALSEATHMAMLSVDVYHLGEETDYSSAKYFGDMVIDIDHGVSEEQTLEQALEKSITSVNTLLDYLGGMGDLNQLKLFISGKKGFHLQIPWELMHSKKAPVRDLPRIYKYIAKRMIIETGATGIDEAVYAGKRGHLIRIPNKKRQEGTYKVQVTVDEVRAMTVERYRELAAHPRPLFEVKKGAQWMMLVPLMQAAKILPTAMVQDSPIPDEFLAEFGTDKHPECISRLVHGKKEKAGITFNGLTTQLAIYYKAVTIPESERNMLTSTFVAHNKSTTSKSAEVMVRHLELEVAPYVKNMQFSCQAMRGHVEMTGGCVNCPVQEKVAADLSTATRISETDTGTYFISHDGAARMLMNFTVEIEDRVCELNYNGKLTENWAGGTFGIYQGDIRRTGFTARRDVLESAKEFKSAFYEFPDGIINVTDIDVTNLRTHLMAKIKGQEGMRQTASVGIRKHKYVLDETADELETMMWIENGWSTTSEGMTGSVKLKAKVKFVVEHMAREVTRDYCPELEETMLHLLRSSEVQVVGLLLGWVCATQIKEHIMDQIQEFPLLNLVGQPGSGKTSLASVFACVGSADYITAAAPTLEMTTAAPLKEMAGETTSIPRIIDECRKAAVNIMRWGTAKEVLKACYQQSSLLTGGISNKKGMVDGHGVVSYSITATAPIIYLSTTSMDEQELQERTVEVKIFKGIQNIDKYRTNFLKLKTDRSQRKQLHAWAKTLLRAALVLKPEMVWDKFEANHALLPEHFDSRTRNSFAWVLLGLEFLHDTMSTLKYPKETLAELAEVKSYTLNWIIEHSYEIHASKSRTDIDDFFEKLAQTASRIDHNGNPFLRSGIHYVRVGNILYISPDSSIGEYRATCRWTSQRAEFSSVRQLQAALEGQEFYLGEERMPNPMGVMMKWLKFDINGLQAKGTDCSRFLEG
jgi:hypothetical protein